MKCFIKVHQRWTPSLYLIPKPNTALTKLIQNEKYHLRFIINNKNDEDCGSFLDFSGIRCHFFIRFR